LAWITEPKLFAGPTVFSKVRSLRIFPWLPKKSLGLVSASWKISTKPWRPLSKSLGYQGRRVRPDPDFSRADVPLSRRLDLLGGCRFQARLAARRGDLGDRFLLLARPWAGDQPHCGRPGQPAARPLSRPGDLWRTAGLSRARLCSEVGRLSD